MLIIIPIISALESWSRRITMSFIQTKTTISRQAWATEWDKIKIKKNFPQCLVKCSINDCYYQWRQTISPPPKLYIPSYMFCFLILLSYSQWLPLTPVLATWALGVLSWCSTLRATLASNSTTQPFNIQQDVTFSTDGKRHLQSQNRLWLWGQRGKIYWTV